MTEDEARAKFAAARVARLATSGPERPRLVPVVFALIRDRIYSAVDQKPKRSTRLARLADIERDPAVSLLVDHYAEDWSTLWWVRADGAASLHDEDDDARRGLNALSEKYPQYHAAPPRGPVIIVDVARWTTWSAGEDRS